MSDYNFIRKVSEDMVKIESRLDRLEGIIRRVEIVENLTLKAKPPVSEERVAAIEGRLQLNEDAMRTIARRLVDVETVVFNVDRTLEPRTFKMEHEGYIITVSLEKKPR